MAIALDELDSAFVKDTATGKTLLGAAILAGTITLNAGDLIIEDITVLGGTINVEPGVSPLVAKIEPGVAPIHAIVDSGDINATIPSRAVTMPLGLVKVDSGNIVVDSVTAQVKANLDSQASFSKDGVLTTSYAEDYITRGMGFEMQRRIALTANQTLYLEINIALAIDKLVYSLPLRMSTNSGNVFVDTYNADSSTGGTFIAVNNLNGLSTNMPLTTVKTGVTPSGTPTKVREYSVGAVKTVQSGGGGAAPSGFPKVLDNTKPLYVKIVNQESAAVVLDFGFVWYEITAG